LKRISILIVFLLLAARSVGASDSFLYKGPSPSSPRGYAAEIAGGAIPNDYGLQEPAGAAYSPGKIGGMSFLLPGLGQHRMGRTTRAYVYFALEAAGWITIGSSLWQSHSRRIAYEEYAVSLADVNGTGHSEDYYEKVGSYISNDGPYGYNEYVMREARDLYYPDREAMDAYFQENAIVGVMGWRWESQDDRKKFNSLRSGSNSAERNAVYAAFYLLGLRVVSAVDAVFIARKTTEVSSTGGMPIRVEAGPRPGGFYIALNRSF
jgi:hypothetical protein